MEEKGEGRDRCEIKAWRLHRGKWRVSDGAFSTQGPEEMRTQKWKSATETGKPLQAEIKTPGEMGELAGKSANCAEIWHNLGRARDTASVFEQRDGPVTITGAGQNGYLTEENRQRLKEAPVHNTSVCPGVSYLPRNPFLYCVDWHHGVL